jgi:hypothetical protein
MREREMGIVVIKCPNTGKEISTGMAMGKGAFETSTMENNRVDCPHCPGQFHTWSKKDAKLKE